MTSVHYVEHAGATIDIGPHVFPIEKYALLPPLLRSELGIEESRFHGPETIADEDLLRVHTAPYVDDLRHARRSPATAASELPVTVPIIDGFIRMAGGTVTTLRLALEHGIGFHVGGGFHHAFAERAEGFCYVNDVAVAIERLRSESGLGRVLVVDVDVHQGNGTAAIYRDRDDTFTYSIHQERNYPVKQRSDLDHGLDDGVGDVPYLAALERDLDRIDAEPPPDLLVYVAGVDPSAHDQLGGLRLTPAGLAARDRLVLRRYRGRGIPVAVVLAGGYARSAEETTRLHLGTAREAEAAVTG